MATVFRWFLTSLYLINVNFGYNLSAILQTGSAYGVLTVEDDWGNEELQLSNYILGQEFNVTKYGSTIVGNGCFTCRVGTYASRYVGTWRYLPEYYVAPSFELFINNIPLTLVDRFQTHTYSDYDSDDGSFGYSEIYFCTNMFDWNQTQTNSTDLAIIEIEMNAFPENLKLEISKYNNNSDDWNLAYSNDFQTNINEETDNSNYSLIFYLSYQDCYQFTYIDNTYDAIETNAAHVSYKIVLNSMVIELGGYYHESENNVICPYLSNYYCIIRNRCKSISIDKDMLYDGELIEAYSFESYYNVTFWRSLGYSSDYGSIHDCFGSNSCQNMKCGDYCDTNWYCYGIYSCDNINIQHNYKFFYGIGDYLGIEIYCNGLYSCHNIQTTIQCASTSDVVTLNCDGINSCCGELRFTLDDSSSSSCTSRGSEIYLIGTMVSMHSYIISNDVMPLTIYVSGYFAMYNVNVFCSTTNENCQIYCLDNSYQWFEVFDNDTNYNATSTIHNCNQYDGNKEIVFNHTGNDSTTTLTDSSMIDDSILLILLNKWTEIESFMTDLDVTCSISYDIGYPQYASSEIINNNEFESICCRGYASCYAATIIQTNLGNMYCIGAYSCADSVLSISDASSSSSSSSLNNSYGKSIYCLAGNACSQSAITSNYEIICMAKDSCESSVILDGSVIYCTMQACSEAQISNIGTIYIIDKQTDLKIFSSNIGEMTVYLRGIDTSIDGNVQIDCSENDVCTIDCKQNACEELWLYCYGKCIIYCDESLNISCPIVKLSVNPTQSPTNAPSNAPTYSPTNMPSVSPTAYAESNSSAITEEDIETGLQWVLLAIAIITFIIAAIGFIDAKKIRQNDLFDYKAIIVFAFYSADFVSDVFFAARLLLLSDDTFYLVLFILSVVFIVTPLFVNVMQLDREIKYWSNDVLNDQSFSTIDESNDNSGSGTRSNNNKHGTKSLSLTNVNVWIKSRIKLIYILTFICGSSFSTIALCNCYLLQMDMFSMGLSLTQSVKFQNKRIFSIVMFENFPQLCIQVALLLHAQTEADFDISNEIVTIFSLGFTLISILISISEYFLSLYLLKNNNLVLISFEIQNATVENMSFRGFESEIIFKHKKFKYAMARILEIDTLWIERLKPIRTQKGARIVLCIHANQTELDNQTIDTNLTNQTIARAFQKSYKLADRVIVIDSFVSRFKDEGIARRAAIKRRNTVAIELTNNNSETGTRDSAFVALTSDNEQNDNQGDSAATQQHAA